MSYINLQNISSNSASFKNNGVGLLSKAYYENKNNADWASNYGFTDWSSDAARDYYRSLQKGQMQQAQDKMTVSSQNIDDAQQLLQLYDELDQQTEQQQINTIQNRINDITERMRQNGSWSYMENPNKDSLQKIIDFNQKEYDENLKSYNHDLNELNESINNYDISQYYTRRSNDTTAGWGNLIYTMPATMGTSNTSALYQTTSMLAGFAGFKAGAAAGAAIGTMFGGPVGTAAGAILGGLVSIGASQLFGGMRAREDESHMEAFNGYAEKVQQLADKRKIDLKPVINNTKKQLLERGIDISNLQDNEIIQAALADKDIISGSSEFDSIAKEAYLGTRRIYEQNNALGFGEVLSDLSYFVPLGSYVKNLGKGVVKAAGKAVSTPFNKFLAKRTQQGLQIANMGADLRKKIIYDKLQNFVTGSIWRSAIEGSEEGAQNVIIKKYLNDEYADEYANASLVDALTDGQIAGDLLDNLWLRTKTLGAAFNINHEYQNDQQLFEEMLGGALLPFFSPQGAIGSVISARRNYQEITQSKKVGDHLATALMQQDEINRNAQFYKIIREGVNRGTYSDLLDRIGSMIKDKGPDGKTRKYNLDTTLFGENDEAPTDEDIDNFIKDQKREYNRLIAHKKRASEQLKKLGLEQEDEDLLLALQLNAEQEAGKGNYMNLIKGSELASNEIKISEDEQFRTRVNNALNKQDLTDEDYLDIVSLIRQNQMIDYYNGIIEQSIIDNQIKTALEKSKISKYSNLEDSAINMTRAIDEKNNAVERRNKMIQSMKDGNKFSDAQLEEINQSLLDNDQMQNLSKDSNTFGILNIITPLLDDKYDKLRSTNKDYIKQQIDKYRNSQHVQSKLADAVNEASRNQEEVQEIEETKSEAKIDEAATPEIQQLQQTTKEEINQSVAQFDSILSSIPENSYLYGIVEEVNKGKQLVADNPIKYARYLKNVMRRLSSNYKNKAEGEGVSEEDKNNLKNLQTIAENVDKKITQLTDLIAEEAARNQRHNPKFPSDTSVWFDENGDRYVFDFTKSEYSENEGLILSGKKLSDNKEDIATRSTIDKLKKERDKIATKNDDQSKRAVNTLNNSIEQLEKRLADSMSTDFTISSDDEMLQRLTTKDNLGNERLFSNKLKKLVNSVQEDIDANKKSRNRKKLLDSTDGDTYEFNFDKEIGKQHGPQHQQELIEKSKDRPLMIKGYPLNNEQGAKIASMLLNPYYAGKFWHGFITAPYSSSEEAKEYISKEYAIAKKFGKVLNRYDAIDDFNKIGKQIAYLQDKGQATDEIVENLVKLANGEVSEIKVGMAKLTKEQYDNIIYALPTRIYFNQKRVGNKWSYVVGADFTGAGYTTIPSQAEIDSRTELIHNLWYNYKTVDKKSKEKEGLDADGSNDKKYINRVYFGNEDMIVTSSGYNFQVTTIRNPNLNIYQNEAGEQMSNADINEYYDNKIPQAIEEISKHLDGLISLLKELGYDVDTKSLNEPIDAEHSDVSKLSLLLKGIAKYGDGLLNVNETLIPNYISKSIGQPIKKSSKIKQDNINKMKRILHFVQSSVPEIFLSYRNYQDDNNLTPPVSSTVVDALQNRWFNSKDGIKIFVDGEEVNTANTEDNINALTTIGETFERLIRDSKTARQFINSLHDLGYTFKKNNNEDAATSILAEYFNNRRFSKMVKPTNVMQAITMGSAEPLNNIDYENFNRITKHEQSKLNQIKSLGLIKGQNGQYVFSLTDWMKRNASSEESEEARQSEFEVRKKEIEKEKKERMNEFAKFKKDEMVKFIIDNKLSFSDEEFDKLVRTNRKGDIVLVQNNGVTKALVRDILSRSYDEQLDALQTKIDEEVEKQVAAETEFSGKKTLPVTIAYGSYDSESGSNIIYFNEKGEKVTMKNVNGRPGAIYLVVPSFLNSSRRSTVLHLNPKRFDQTMATFLATVLKNIQDGKLIMNGSVNQIEGYDIDTDMTVKQLLDNFIYTGTDAITNNPSDNNYARLLYVNNGKVIFGTQTLDDTNFDQLVDFIMEKKNYRIDRQKLSNSATLGNNLTIKYGDEVLYDHKSDEIYTSILIDDGIVLTDINRTSNTITAKPSVYVNYNKKVTFVSSAQRSQNKGTAASGKQKLAEEVNRETLQEEIENEVVEGGTKGAFKYIENFVKGFRERALKFAQDNGLKPGDYKVGIWGMKSEKVVKTFDASISVDSDTGEQALTINDQNNFKSVLTKALINKKRNKLVLLDAEGNVIKTDKGSMFFGKGFQDTNFSQTDDSSSSNKGSSTEIDKLVESVAKLSEAVAQMMTTGKIVPTNVPAAAVTSNSQDVPVGFNGINTPVETSSGAPVVVETAKGKVIQFEEEDNQETTFSVSNGIGTFKKDGYEITLPVTAQASEIEDSFDEDAPVELIDEAIEAFANANKQQTSNEQVAEQPGLNLRPNPLTAILEQSEQKSSEKQAAPKKQEKKQLAQGLPNFNELMSFLNSSSINENKKLQQRIKDLTNSEDKKQAKDLISAALAKYMVANKQASSPAIALLDNQLQNTADAMATQLVYGGVNTGAIFEFLDQHVQKEDYDSALDRVTTILGNDFDFSFLPEGKRVYDKVRQAQIYVFGECAASGIRLYRDAKLNKIARGSFYHEAFHRISLFVLSKEQRDKMYDDARNSDLNKMFASNQEIEEYLADRFAEFVLDSQSEHPGKYYSGNIFNKAFQYIADAIRNIIRRLSSKNITPNYTGIDKLFKDMYSGRYAYAKATKNNIEEFEKIYGKSPVYSGFKSNGVTLAADSVQYNEIFRDMLGKLIYNSGIYTDTSGNIVIDTNSLKASYENDIVTYTNALIALDNKLRNRQLGDNLSRFKDDDIVVAQAKMVNLINVYKNIVQPKAWKEWANIINKFVEMQFNITKITSNNPNKVLKADIKEDTDIDADSGENELEVGNIDVLGFSEYRDSYMRNMYNTMDANMKMLLWSITDLKPSDANTAKYTADGLLKFANVRDLYTRIVHAISGANTVEEMLNKLHTAATTQMQEEDSATMMQVYEILSHPNTNPAMVNRFFTDFVKYIHNFETHSYTTIGYSGTGSSKESRYSATTKNGSLDAVQSKLDSKWKSGMTLALDSIADKVNSLTSSSDRSKLLKQIREPLTKALNKLNVNDIESIKNVIKEAQKLYSFGSITDDLDNDALIWQKAMQNAQKAGKPGKTLLLNPLQKLNLANSSEFRINENGKKRSQGIYKTLNDMFAVKGILTNLSQLFGNYVETMPSTQSQKGPGNTKIYSIGQYNFITRTFQILANTKSWLSKMMSNSYNFHSTWLDTFKSGNSKVKVHTKLSTVLDDQFDDSVADKEVTEFEDLLNRYVSIWSGKHVAPALANKRFALDIEGIPMMESVIDSLGNISKKAVNTFIGYVADEILAISDAIYTRKYFIDQLNKILKSNYTVDSFSNLTGLEQEKIFKNNPEASKLLRLLVKTYHYASTNTQYLIDEKNDRIVKRAFHIDLREGKGYKFRHYGNIMKDFKFDNQLVESLSSDVFSTDSREQAKNKAYKLADTGKTRVAVAQMLQDNIFAALSKFSQLRGIYVETDGNILGRYLPQDVIKKYLYGKESANIGELKSFDYFRAIGGATVQAMSDIAEFEKLCHGDIAYHKNIDGVTKRYSGIVSTTSLTSNKSTMINEFADEDRLYNAETYNAVALNTTIVANKAKYYGEAQRTLGVSPDKVNIKLTPNKKGKLEISVDIDTSDMIDNQGNIKQEYTKAALISRLLKFREQRRLKVMLGDTPMNDSQLLEVAVNDFKNRFEGYLTNDPTDAQSWITGEMFRQLKQRKGAWNDVSEACYNLLTYYDRFGDKTLKNSARLTLATKKMCNTLGIKYEDLISKAEAYRKDKNSKEAKQYKGWIFGIVDKFKFESPSLKYIYYGYDTGRMDGLTTPIYDKSSYRVLWKIEVEGHEMENMYNYMVDNNVDVMKQETATKSGGLPSFELYDENGNFDNKALEASIIQSQYFDLLGDQLNTASHHTNDASLLTQFMKVAMMNTSEDNRYRVNGKTVNGAYLRNSYKQVLDELTKRGFHNFSKEWGIQDGTIDKRKFMSTLQKMAQTENLPAETIAAFSVDENGEFKIHPAAMPNIAWIMSRLLASMGDTIIDTTTPGKALYQVSSLGYDNFLSLKKHSDKHLYMPGEIDEQGNIHNRMQVRLSINFFDSVIEQARKEGVKGYDFDNFEDQKRFILNNKELFALSYRVPTQGQNSTISIEIVDLVPSVQGSMIQFPAGITALTGSDFDIDKMFLARYNYEVVNGKMQKVKYNAEEIINNINSATDAQLQNFLLDMYHGVLTSPDHALATATPLDVCTGPIKDFAKKEIKKYQDGKEDGIPEGMDGFYLNPVFQNRNKKLNSGSDEGIGPMALNSVFQFHTQVSNLKMLKLPILQQLGLNDLGQTFDKNGEEILDSTSGLINAFVDAAKDNYIGNANVNSYTFDIVAMLIASGMGNDTFAFLTQPIIKEISDSWLSYKKGLIGVSDEEKSGNYFMDVITDRYADMLENLGGIPAEADYGKLMSHDSLMSNLTPRWNDSTWVNNQLNYLNIFKDLFVLAKEYHKAISNAQIDTKKYGVTANQFISFIQSVDEFTSQYNIAFKNPQDLYDKTFLGNKYKMGVMGLFNIFKPMLPEFSDVYVNTANELSKQFGVYGRTSKEFLRVVGPKIKTVLYSPFFNQYIVERFKGAKPLATLTYGDLSVPGRYDAIRRKALQRNEGIDFFNAVKYNKIGDVQLPQFMLVNGQFKDNPDIKNNVQLALSELFNSADLEIRQWANDFAVYMFYVSGGTDSNAGGVVRTTIYDIIPPQYLSNLKAGGMTFSQFVQNNVMNRKGSMSTAEKNQILSLLAVSDDKYVPKIVQNSNKYIVKKIIGNDVVAITKGSYSLFSRNTNTFKPYIKIANQKGYDLYKLGDQIKSVGKDKKEYTNPVYYKVNKLGYRSNARFAFSLRADGYIDQNNNLRSLLWKDADFNATQYNALDDKQKAAYLRATKLNNANEVTNAVGPVDYSKDFDPNHDVDNTQMRAMVDLADAIYLIADDAFADSSQIRSYAMFKNKEFHVITSDQENIPTANGNTIAIFGVDTAIANDIYQSNKDKDVLAYGEIKQSLSQYQKDGLNLNKTKSSEEVGKEIKDKCKN